MSLETAVQNLAEAITEANKLKAAELAAAGAKPAATKEAKTDKPAATKAADKPAAKGKGKKEEVEEEEEEDFGEGAGEDGDVTIDDVRTALGRYSKFDSKPEAIKILKKYTKSGRVDQLDEGDYAALVEELEGLMA